MAKMSVKKDMSVVNLSEVANRIEAVLSDSQESDMAILVVAQSVPWLDGIKFMFATDFVLLHRIKLQLCDSLNAALYEIETNDYCLVLLEKSFQSLGGKEFEEYVEQHKCCRGILIF